MALPGAFALEVDRQGAKLRTVGVFVDSLVESGNDSVGRDELEGIGVLLRDVGERLRALSESFDRLHEARSNSVVREVRSRMTRRDRKAARLAR
jgi:hypothetical protein